MQLNDPKLFRQQAYIDGSWVDADNGKTILSGYGNSPTEVLRSLRDNAYDLCKLGADAYDLSSLEAK